MMHYIRWFCEAAVFALAVMLPAILLLLFLRFLRMRHGKPVSPLRTSRVFLDLLLAGDLLITLFLTLVSRESGTSSVNLVLFSSWREAWNGWSATLFKLLFLNIAVFIPLGILLSLRFSALRRLRYLTAAGFICSLFIELTQLVTARGVFDLDDLFCNTLGTLLGGSLVCFICALRRREWKPSLLYAQPLLLCGVGCALLFGAYAVQPYGNLPSDYSYRLSMRNVQITVDVDLQARPASAPVYAATRYTPAEAEAYAAGCFTSLGFPEAEFSVNHGSYPGDTESYFTLLHGEGLVLIFNRRGGSYTLIRESNAKALPSPAADDAQDIAAWLTSLGVMLPDIAFETASASANMDGSITRWQFTPPPGSALSGRLTLTLYADGAWEIDSTLIKLHEAAREPIYTPVEALEHLREGKFRWYGDPFHSLHLISLTLEYTTDTKGFSVPVWRAAVIIDGNRSSLVLRALR